MSVLQPLYFAGGRYTASTDRKLLAALIDPESDGRRIGGVIPPAGSMQVAATAGLSLSIAPGFCVIPDSSSPSGTSPGLYLCSIDSASEGLTLASASGLRTDLIYASVNETNYTITGKTSNGTSATLTTSAAHGFSIGQTVLVSGVDDFFNGSYVITGVTSTTFTYARSGAYSEPSNSGLGAAVTAYAEGFGTPPTPDGLHRVSITNKLVESNLVTLTTSTAHTFVAGSIVRIQGVSDKLDGVYETITGTTASTIKYLKATPDEASTVVSTSSVAIARVPFAIKVAQGTTTLPAGTNLKLATVAVENSAISLVTDVRKFTTALGGVHLFNSALEDAVDPASVAGHLRYDTNSRTLSIYDSTTATWRVILNGSTGTHDVTTADSYHFTIGGGASQAAAGNHNHGGQAVGNGFIGIYGGNTQGSASLGDITVPANRSAFTSSGINVNFTTPASGRVLVQFSATLQTKTLGKTTAAGISISGPGGITASSPDFYNTIRVSASATTSGTFVRQAAIFVFEGSVDTTYNALINVINTDTVSVSIANPVIRITPMP